MGEFFKKNWVTVVLSVGTVVLAGVAIFTAVRLYQLRSQSVAPNVPESEPFAAEEACPANTCQASTGECVGYASQTEQQCGTVGAACQVCSAGLVCENGVCVESTSCEALVFSLTTEEEEPTATPTLTPTPTGTGQATATPSPTATATAKPGPTATATTPVVPAATATPAPSLPEAGVSLPAIVGVGVGAILLILGFALMI